MNRRRPNAVDIASSESTQRSKALAGAVVFGLWFIAVSVPLSYLTGLHLIPVPGPSAKEVHVAAMPPGGNEGWRAVHILAADCGCSHQIAEYLVRRGKTWGLDEIVWVIGTDEKLVSELRQGGYLVESKDPEQAAAEQNIQGAPWLILQSPSGEVAYSGGYGPRPSGGTREVKDLALWNALLKGERPNAFPAFGCATSRALNQTLDPLNLKGRSAPFFSQSP